MGKCCWDLLKFFVFVLTFAAFAAAAGLFSLSIFVLFRSEDVLGFHISTDLSPSNPTAIHFSIILIFIVLSAFFTLFTFMGCCGAACANRCMLGSFIIILFVFLGGYVGAIIYIFMKFPNEVQMIASELEKTIPYYKADDPESLVRQFWDFVQPAVGCCGVESWRDWRGAESGLKQSRQVPVSCCRKTASNSNIDCVFNPDSENAYLQGCLNEVELPVRIVFWAIPSIMAILLIATLCLCSNCNKSNNSEDDEAEVLTPRRKLANRRNISGNDIEETGYQYHPTPTPNYPSAPPYNPEYGGGRSYSSQYYGQSSDAYPTGVIPPHCQPLMQPPSYHEVVGR